MSIKASILIVDDDPHFTKTLADILSLHGYAPLAAAKGKTALNRVKKERPAVALIDLKLPDMDGLEVMEEIKKRSPATGCIVLTGYASQVSAIKAVNLGAYGYMQKPYDVEQLVLTIRRAVEKRETEEALRESEQRYRQLFEGMADAVMVLGSQGKFLDCNETTLQRLGYNRQELLHLGAADIVHPDFHPLVKENLKRIWDGETTTVESAQRCKDGRVIPVEVNARRIEYRGESAVLAVVRDITERKRAEEALRESEKRFRELVENANDIIYTHDVEGNFASVNPAATRIYGYTIEEVLQLNIADIVDPDYLPLARQKIREKVEGSPRTGPYELLTYGKEGDPIWVEVSTRLIEREGQPVGVQGIARDITERKRAEEALGNAALETLEALSQLVEAKDPYTAGHSAGVTELAIEIAKEMELGDGEIDTLRIAGPIHDVGKVGIAGSVLNKPARLTQAEWVMIQAHPVVSAQTAERVAAFKDAVSVIRHHHERWDGTGYPDGLEGEDIPLLARILAVADGFEAMTSERPYRRARTEEEALAELEKGAGSQWDPEVVKVFLRFRKPPPKRKSKRKRRK